jgi:hypothetical protein
LPNRQAVALKECQLARHKNTGPKTEKKCCSVFDLRISPLRQCKHGCKKEEKRKEKSKTKKKDEMNL